MHKRMTRQRFRLNGQAMTEVLVAASFILVPLFLIIPAFGKFIDMRQATIQAARYQAWEYTVWYAENCERVVFSSNVFDAEECPMGGIPTDVHNNMPFKTRELTRRESIARYYATPDGAPLAVVSGAAGAAVPTPTNLLWYDHTGARMVDDAIGGGEPVSSQSPKGIPVLDTVFDVVLGAIKLVFGAFADVLGFLGSDAGFDAINTDGLASSQVAITMDSTAVKTLMRLGPDLTFSIGAAVLTDGWNTGGREHTYNQASGMIVTSGLKALQNLPGISQAWDIITAIIAPELRRCNVNNYLEDPWDNYTEDNKGSLWFGHVDSEAVHRDRLDDGSETHSCDDAGRCDFDDTFTREKECIP